MIKFEGVNYVYNRGSIYEKKALDNINIEIHEHKIIGLVGKSGSGKTTFIQHFNKNLLQPSSGKVFIGKQKVGIVFQYPEHQIFEMTVEEEIGFGLKKLCAEKKLDLIIESLKAVGLNDKYLNKNPFNLSGGEKRRVAIASILAMEPDILILDEPTVGLDTKTRKKLMEQIINSNEKKARTIIIASHDMDMIYEIAEEIILMDSGKIIFYDTASKILELGEEKIPKSNINRLVNSLNSRGIFLSGKNMKFDDLIDQLVKAAKQDKDY